MGLTGDASFDLVLYDLLTLVVDLPFRLSPFPFSILPDPCCHFLSLSLPPRLFALIFLPLEAFRLLERRIPFSGAGSSQLLFPFFLFVDVEYIYI